MKKKYGVFIILVIVFILGINFFDKEETTNKKIVVYKGENLRISIDGITSNTLPTSGTYYLVDYDCGDANTVLDWDMDNYKLNVTNGTKGNSVSCNLAFKSNPKLAEMPVGSYVKYTGVGGTVGSTSVACQTGGSASSSTATDETESPNSCSGQNAREDIDTNGNTYGYCQDSNYKYYTTGWRIAYISDDNNPVIISAGSPECIQLVTSTNNETYIKTANAKALKYCNNDFVDGDCSCIDDDANGLCDEASSDAWAINATDFNMITSQATSTAGGYLYVNVSGAISCGNVFSTKACGYNNDLIDNGSFYWFATKHIDIEDSGVRWSPKLRNVSGNGTSTYAMGLRPVISLSSSVIVLSGKGTMEDPYVIGNNTFSINGGVSYIGSSDDKSNVTLILIGTSEVAQMCINVNSSGCSNYVDFAESYTLDWSNEDDGEKVVYVYYKDADGNIVASMSQSVILDTSGPGTGTISFVDGDGLSRTLNVNSKDADYMCFSNTSNNINDCTEWVTYAKTYSWLLEQGTGTKTVYAFFKDEAGNTVGPYSATTTCTNDCEHKYFVDAYNDSNIYIMRNDGATAMVTTGSTDITWYSKNTQKMNVCGTDNYSKTGASAYIWCIGEDNNAYYKTSVNDTVWNKVSISSNIDTSTYTYSIYPYYTSYAYIVRSDGKTNRISTSGLASNSWNYGYSRDMAVCSGYSSSRVACLGKDGKYYYSTGYSNTTDYSGGSIVNLTDRTNENSWIDMYYNIYTNIIESDGTNLYTSRFDYNATSAVWHTSTIPGDGIEYCASGGYSTNNYCLAKDGYLYYKDYAATSWTKSSLLYE